MAITVKHSTVVTVPDDGTSPVGSDEWNAGHVVTGLENVDNTSDVNKPVSTAQAAADAAVAANAANASNLTSGTVPNARLDAELQAVAGLTSAADTVPYFTGLATAALAAFTAFGRSLLASSSAAAVRSLLGIREVLAAPRTYYVRTDGSDSNTGLANTAGGAWLTWQHGLDTIQATLDLAKFTVTLQAGEATATFAAGFALNGPCVGDIGTGVQVVGNPSTTITAATNATPIVITALGHNYVNGDNVVISNVAGNTAANGSHKVASANTGLGTFALTTMAAGANVAGTGAYTSGGTCQAVNKIKISTTLWPVTVGNGAYLNMSGFELDSSAVQCVVVQDGAFARFSKMMYGNSGTGIQPFFITRYGRCILGDNYSIGASGGGTSGLVQASHTGNWRQELCNGYAVANLTYDTSLNSGILFVDNGEIVTTASPGGSPFLANGFTVTGRKWVAVERGLIQVEGAVTSGMDSILFGSVSGQEASLPSGGIAFASLPVAAAALMGARYFITDCNSTTFHATAAGGGANKVPVVCDGSVWLIG